MTSPPNQRLGRPATHTAPSAPIATTIAVPMSRPSMTAPRATRTGRPTATLIALISERFAADLETMNAKNTTSASFKNSDGWAITGPSFTQFALPPSERPSGLSTSDWNASAPTNMGTAIRISHRCGTSCTPVAINSETTMIASGRAYAV